MARVVLFFQQGEYELMHQGLSAAAAAAALGDPVELYFFWHALGRLVEGPLDAPAHEETADRLEARGVPSLAELLKAVRGSGQARVLACSGSLAALGLTPADVEPHVDELVGWAGIVQRTRGVVDRFFF
jgi:peroxiredoxin family protein